MQSVPLNQRIRIDEGTSPFLMTRCLTNKKVPLVKANINTLTYTVFDISNGSTPVIKQAETSLVLADVWFDTMQTGDEWTIDDTGYNFGAEIPGTCFTSDEVKGKTFRVEIRGTKQSGNPFWVLIVTVDINDALTDLT
jgi:hypothetical protein